MPKSVPLSQKLAHPISRFVTSPEGILKYLKIEDQENPSHQALHFNYAKHEARAIAEDRSKKEFTVARLFSLDFALRHPNTRTAVASDQLGQVWMPAGPCEEDLAVAQVEIRMAGWWRETQTIALAIPEDYAQHDDPDVFYSAVACRGVYRALRGFGSEPLAAMQIQDASFIPENTPTPLYGMNSN